MNTAIIWSDNFQRKERIDTLHKWFAVKSGGVTMRRRPTALLDHYGDWVTYASSMRFAKPNNRSHRSLAMLGIDTRECINIGCWPHRANISKTMRSVCAVNVLDYVVNSLFVDRIIVVGKWTAHITGLSVDTFRPIIHRNHVLFCVPHTINLKEFYDDPDRVASARRTLDLLLRTIANSMREQDVAAAGV